MTYEILENGAVIPELIGQNEFIKFDITDSGAVLYIAYDRPTPEEVNAITKSGSRFEIRFTKVQDILFFTFKFGSLSWMDAPFSLSLAQNLNSLQTLRDGEGLALHIVFVDSRSGAIVNQRLIGLTTDFTWDLYDTLHNIDDITMSEDEYQQKIYLLTRQYSTKELVSRGSVHRCVINKDL